MPQPALAFRLALISLAPYSSTGSSLCRLSPAVALTVIIPAHAVHGYGGQEKKKSLLPITRPADPTPPSEKPPRALWLQHGELRRRKKFNDLPWPKGEQKQDKQKYPCQTVGWQDTYSTAAANHRQQHRKKKIPESWVGPRGFSSGRWVGQSEWDGWGPSPRYYCCTHATNSSTAINTAKRRTLFFPLSLRGSGHFSRRSPRARRWLVVGTSLVPIFFLFLDLPHHHHTGLFLLLYR